MTLWKKVRCNRGHIHKVMSVGELILPYYCTMEDQQEAARKSQGLPNKRLQQNKAVIESLHTNKFHNTPTEKGNEQMEQTEALHNDSRPTVILVGNKVYDLVLSTQWTKASLEEAVPPERPHVRHLNPIPVRSKEQQKIKNDSEKHMAELCSKIPKGRNTPLSKSQDNIASGINPEIEIKKLLGLKEKAVKDGNNKEAGRIRKALRKLGYKRYTSVNEQEEANGDQK